MSGSAVLGKADRSAVKIDVDALVSSRLLLTAMSGAGKSWALRRILEQTHGQVQHLVIDPEGEFYTLRERFDYVLAGGEGADCAAEPSSAHLLALKLLELGASAVLDIYELDPHARVEFVERFLRALVNAPRKLWRPVLVVIDEAHVFAPEKGSATSSGSVAALMTRGRKRGFAGLLATQRLSELSKTAAAQAGNILIGRSRLDVDLKRSAEALGFPSKADYARIRSLDDGEFWSYGPALTPDVTKVRVGTVRTTHPRPGKTAAPTPPAPGAIARMLKQLIDLPQKARVEAASVGELRSRVRDLERELRTARKGAPSSEDLKAARVNGARHERARLGSTLTRIAGRHQQAASLLERAVGDLGKLADIVREQIDVELDDPAPARGPGPEPRTALAHQPSQAPRPHGGPAQFRGGMGRMLGVLARGRQRLTEAQWATLSRLKRSGGTWGTYKSRLVTLGYVQRDGSLWFITDAGVEVAGDAGDAPKTTAELVEMWCDVLGRKPGEMLRLLVSRPAGLTRSELAGSVGLEQSGGTFGTYLSRLSSNGLITREGDAMHASDALWLNGS